MKKLLLFLPLLLLAAPAFGQNSIGWYHGPLDAHNCPVPDPKQTFLCAWDTEEVKISSKGAPYDDPKNMLTSFAFSVDFAPVAVGPAGTQPTFVNKGTASAQVWQLTLPPPAAPTKWTTLTCDSITGQLTVNGGVITITKPTGVNCTQQ